MTHTTADRPRILLTGVTGGLGCELLPRLLDAFPEHHIVVPVRASGECTAAARLDAVLDYAGIHGPSRDRVELLAADLAAPGLGLPPREWEALAAACPAVFHLAANVDFGLDLAASRQANVDTTRQVLALARQAARHHPAMRLNYVSTAFVAGTRRGLLREDELAVGQSFWNAYEQSKLEAEVLVEAAKGDLPVTVYRPSQILGDSASGRIRKFFGFYEFLKLAALGKLRVLVGDPRARVDMVPSDFVCEAMLCLARDPDAAGGTFHLAAGVADSLSVSEVVDLVYGLRLDTGEPALRMRRPHILRPEGLGEPDNAVAAAHYHSSPLKLLMRTYLPYLSYERDFDVARTHRRLAAAGVTLPPIGAALRTTSLYAVRQGFTDPASAAARGPGGASLPRAQEAS